jgi:hypothetical protein
LTEIRRKIGRPLQLSMAQPCFGEVLSPRGRTHRIKRPLLFRTGHTCKGKCDRAQTQIEQSMPKPRLHVVVLLRLRLRENPDLTLIQSETLMDPTQLRLDRLRDGMKILVAQLSTIAGAIAEFWMSASDCVANTTETFFLRSVFSHSRSRAAKSASSRNTHASSRVRRVGAPSKRSSIRSNS